jgi:hypothetical protein
MNGQECRGHRGRAARFDLGEGTVIHLRTGIALATAGLGTMAAGTITAGEPRPAHGAGVSRGRIRALGLGLGGGYAGVLIALTGPGTSLRPAVGVTGAMLGGLLLGEHVLGPLVHGRRS